MSTGNQKRNRGRRVTTFELPPGRWATLLGQLRRGGVVLRLLMCTATALALWAMTQGWNPPREFRPDRIPVRDVIARTYFEQPDDEALQEARRDARRLAIAVYDQDAAPLQQLEAELLNDINQLIAAEEFSEVDLAMWEAFSPPLAEGTPQPTVEEQAEQFDRFRTALTAEGASERFKLTLDEIFAPLVNQGIIDQLPEDHDANTEQIDVRPLGSTEFPLTVAVGDVLLDNVANGLQRTFAQKLSSLEVADRVFAWIKPRLPVTLRLNMGDTRARQQEAADAAEAEPKRFEVGDKLADARGRLEDPELEMLELEYQQEIANRTLEQRVRRSLAVLGMYVALFTVCGFFVYKLDPEIVRQLPRLATVLVTILATVGSMLVAHGYHTQAEVIPLLLFGMTMAIAAGQEIALLLSAALTLVGVVSVGGDLSDAIVMLAATTGAILVLDSVRTRSKLLIVGFVAALVAFFTMIGVNTVMGQPIAPTFRLALMLSLWSVIAGSLMTCVLPLVERVFNVQTDLSLLELGDPSHPLLQELIRRAPGTYNHSITVASLAEAATEAIGGRSLLVRVGAYFHDIGKMLKPGYFIENQGQGNNRHDTLAPAMSTLVIIAHVKDGADLARQNKLPECIIDFIQQHHGTTLVEYFYRQETARRGADPDASEVDESSFRYPGPKPQSKEAGVLMLSDAVESASRVLVEPTPSRIENLVDEISKKRLADGQFDECGLTLEEVSKIGDSLVKSLTAVYHGRVKYPDQETA
ncbi:MAG: HDIG domain-containing metalloprotein [Planctomycetota bacterium]